MRRSGWLLVGPGLLVWLAAIALPATALVVAAATGSGPDGLPGVRHAFSLLGVTFAWALAVTGPAVLLGWVPGRLLHAVLAASGSRTAVSAVAVASVLLVPVFLPSHLAYFAWWQALGPDGALGAWMIRHDLVAPARHVVLWLALVCWAWPLAAWCIAAGCGASAETAWSLRLDGAGWLARVRTALVEDRAGLGLAATIVVLFTLGNTSAFDLAQVRSIGFEIRTLDTQGATPAALLRGAWPAVVAAIALAVLAWRAVGRISERSIGAPPARGRGSFGVVAAIVLATVVLPMTLLLGRLGTESRWGEFLSLYGPAVANTLAASAGAAVAGGLVGLAAAACRLDGGRAARLGASAMGIALLLAGAVPGTLVAAGVAAAYNRAVAGALIYDTPVAVTLGLAACFGFVAACIGRLAAAGEPRSLAEARRLDGASTAGALVRAAGPRLLAAAGCSAAVVFALSMSEVVVAARLQPPGWDALAASMLNAMHYQHTETVMHAVVVLLGLAVVGALAATLAWAPLRLRTLVRAAAPMVLLATALAAPGCRRHDPDQLRPLPTVFVFGSPGRFLGQFDYPRAAAVDAARGHLFVIDKTARVQRFSLDGQPQLEWQMPEWSNGKPTGVSVDADGTVFVADTHYFRVVAFDPDGNELRRFGRYGTGPGEFVYTTDIAFGPDDLLYVSEYGGNDRVQVFDRAGHVQFAFGSHGEGPDQFNRPQALAFSADLAELFIADACNHRIVVTDPRGTVKRTFGHAGRGPGELMYPYGLAILPDGSLLVSEFGNARIQRLDAHDGQSLGMWGGEGFARGQLRFPWAVVYAEGLTYVLDSGNQRVQAARGIEQ